MLDFNRGVKFRHDVRWDLFDLVIHVSRMHGFTRHGFYSILQFVQLSLFVFRYFRLKVFFYETIVISLLRDVFDHLVMLTFELFLCIFGRENIICLLE